MKLNMQIISGNRESRFLFCVISPASGYPVWMFFLQIAISMQIALF